LILLPYPPTFSVVNKEIKLNRLLKPTEAAELFGISIRTLYDWSASGRVPSIKINGALRFDAKEISDWINEHKQSVNRGSHVSK